MRSTGVWLITGGGGQLGLCLAEVLAKRNVEFRAFDRDGLDIEDAAGVSAVVGEIRPSVVVNAAAWTAVDAAEDNRERAFAVNSGGAHNVAAAALEHDASLVHVSTDYVFDGRATAPYDEDDDTGPRSAYGESKLDGERMVRSVLGDGALIVRTAWLYSVHGENFVKTMTRRALADAPVRVVDDQHGQPTHAADLAALIVDLVGAGASGTHHGTSTGMTSWYELTREIYRLLDRDPALVAPCPSSDYPTKATRPRYSVLGHRRTRLIGVPTIGCWDDRLGAAIEGIRNAVAKESK